MNIGQLDYAGLPTQTRADMPPPARPGFWSNLSGAVGRNAQSGGGLPGLVSALSPGFFKGLHPEVGPAPDLLGRL